MIKDSKTRHFLAVTLLLLTFRVDVVANEFNLPSLGDSTSSIVSAKQEYLTGQSWLRAFRRQAPILNDPIIYAYLHDLIQKLAVYSPLNEKYFDLVVIDNKSFNAFAVPGNIIGINTGLFQYAETEDQLASVIAHELAHLSQRHYARSLDKQKQQNLATLAALLGSILVMATTGGDAGVAALTATQAAAIDQQLRYSRTQEQEADRIGMQTLASAGMNPKALAHMFQHMLVETRYRKDIREFDFLLTHPLADTRVSDALNQARSYPEVNDQDSFNFHLVKARIAYLQQNNARIAHQYFIDAMQTAKYKNAMRYGQAISLLDLEQYDDAEEIIDTLYRNSPNQLAYIIAKLQLYEKKNQLEQAESLLQQHLSLLPHNYTLSMFAGNFYIRNHKPDEAVKILRALVRSNNPDLPDVWYLLAEAEGLAGNIAQVHLARAEYFVYIGAFTQAQRHLNLAMPFFKDNIQATSRINLKMQMIEQLKRQKQF